MRATAKYNRDSKTITVNFPDYWGFTTTDTLSQVAIGDEAKLTFNYTNTAIINQASTFKALLSAQPASNSAANYYSSVLLSEFTTNVDLNVGKYLFGVFTHANLKGTGTIANAVGLWGRAVVTNATGTITDAYGVVGQVRTSVAGGAITTGYGILGALRNDVISTITTGAGVAAHVINTTTGTINTAYGVLILTPTNNGTINNLYGLYQQGSEPNYLGGNLVVDGDAAIGTTINAAYALRVVKANTILIYGSTTKANGDTYAVRGNSATNNTGDNHGVYSHAVNAGAGDAYPFKDSHGNYTDANEWVNAVCTLEKKTLVKELSDLQSFYNRLGDIKAYGYRSIANTIIGYSETETIVNDLNEEMPVPIYGNPEDFPEQFGFILDDHMPEFLVKRNKEGKITGYGSGQWAHYLFLCAKYQREISEDFRQRIEQLEAT